MSVSNAEHILIYRNVMCYNTEMRRALCIHVTVPQYISRHFLLYDFFMQFCVFIRPS